MKKSILSLSLKSRLKLKPGFNSRSLFRTPFAVRRVSPAYSSSTIYHPTSPSVLRSKTAKDERLSTSLKLRRTNRRIKVASSAPARPIGQTGGFTIVELIVTIVVIAILATIIVLTYIGIQQKAIVTSINLDLTSAARLLKLFQVDNDSFPTDVNSCPTPTTGKICLKPS